MTTHSKRKTVEPRHVIRKFRQGVSYPKIAQAFGITTDQVRTMIDRWVEREASGVKPIDQTPIGDLYPRKVKAYKCPGCHAVVFLKPCVLCRVRGMKG